MECDLDTAPAKELEPPSGWDETWANLEANLAKREWVAADWSTLKLMEHISSGGQKQDGSWPSLDLGTFPCKELNKINQLWLKYSEGRLGFSVQQQLYLQTGNKLGELHWGKYEAFQKAVGWVNGHQTDDYDLRFPSVIPRGYFPFRLGWDYETFGSGFIREWRAGLNPNCQFYQSAKK